MLKSFVPHTDLVRLQLHSRLVCVLNLQTLTQAISLFFSYLCLVGSFLAIGHSQIHFICDAWKKSKWIFFPEF